jgi:hypothetical protein
MQLRSQSKKITDGLFGLYTKYSSEKAVCQVTEFVAAFKKVEHEYAEYLAADLYDFIASVLAEIQAGAHQPSYS